MRIYIEREGDRIHLHSKWAPGLPEKCKSVGGGRWSKSQRVWTYPLDFGTCTRLRAVFGADLEIGPELGGWARAEKARLAGMDQLSSMVDVELSPRISYQAPELYDAIGNRTYQKVAAKYIADGRNVLIGDQPGLGKTLETISGIMEAGITGPVLVFCPSTAIDSVWGRELRKWAPEDLVFPIMGTKPKRQQALGEALFNAGMHDTKRTWIICNIEMARVKLWDECVSGLCKGDLAKTRFEKDAAKACRGKHERRTDVQYPELFAQPWASIIVDESHRALIAQAAVLKKMTQQRAGMALLPLQDNGLRVALSGTPWRGKAKNFWGTLNWLRPNVYTSFWRWAEQWFDIDDNGYGKVISNHIKEGMEDAFTRELRTIMLRRTKEEVAKDLPPKQYTDVVIPLSPKQRKAYDSFAANGIARLDSSVMSGLGVLAEMTRMKQLSASYGHIEQTGANAEGDPTFTYFPELPSSKFDWVVEFLAERGIEKEEPAGNAKVVLASQWTEVINLYAKELEAMGIPVYTLTGETKQADRPKMIDDFQNNPNSPRVFLLNTYAGGVAVTLDAADDLVFLDKTWIPDDQEQVEDRIHRVSRIHNVNIYSLISEDTIEESITEQNMTLDEIQKTLMDGSRGVDLARQLLKGQSR